MKKKGKAFIKESRLEGHTLRNEHEENDKKHIRDLENLHQMDDMDLDEETTKEIALEHANGEIKRQEAEKRHREVHEYKWNASMREKCRGPLSEQTVLKSKQATLDGNLTRLKPAIDASHSTYKKDKKIHSMIWDSFTRTKFYLAFLGAMIAVLFGILNISRNIRQNNILFADASKLTVVLVSLIFVVPVLAIKAGFDSIDDEALKKKYLRYTFRTMIASGLYFLLVFAYVNSPREVVSPFTKELTSPFISIDLLNYLYLLANILLELSTSVYLTLIATQIYESHSVVSDEYQTHETCKSYEKLMDEHDEIRRNFEITKRRLKVLNTYFEELEEKKKLYLNKARIALSKQLRRT